MGEPHRLGITVPAFGVASRKTSPTAGGARGRCDMTGLQKGLLLAALHVLLVCTLGAKLLYDRATRPRVWVQVATYDPDLPVRGRYLAFNVEVPMEGFTARENPPDSPNAFSPSRGDLALRNGVLTAVANPEGEFWVRFRVIHGQPVAIV